MPLITSIGVGTAQVVRNAYPQYWAATGKRRGRAGFDEFFDFPGTHPEGTRRFEAAFRPVSAKARSIGNRIEVLFQGLKLGIFVGGIPLGFEKPFQRFEFAAIRLTRHAQAHGVRDTLLHIGPRHLRDHAFA